MREVLLVVVSDTIYEGKAPDVSGEYAEKRLSTHGFNVHRVIVPNKPSEIIRALNSNPGSKLVVVIGGTGPSPRDISIDLVESISWKALPGFGEEFRRRSIEKTGLRAILSRAGLYVTFDGRVIAVLPGSPEAVEIGLDILLGVVDHLLEEASRIEGPHKVD
ncbi:MogA/MoaB family molybdenum cofactor biosynthesis protein [Thermogladius sp. 4427co]|uniref:MogA/MoaB family molybdenum cofactor biosynthesis protein n=1 Tax=Thermogladius sp. 4427co TaxID=3450718 RepID=UPI003F7A365B